MGAPPAPAHRIARRFPILSPLRHRDFRFLWAGMSVSLLGDGITTIALAWQAYEISNVPTALALIGVAQTVPHVVLLLVSGAVSDRFERRKVLIAADAVRMLAMCALGVLAVTGTIQIWHMMLIAAAYGAGSAFFGPAFDAVVPDLVPEAELPQANSLDQFVRPALFRMLGPVAAPALPSSPTRGRSRCRSAASCRSAGIRSASTSKTTVRWRTRSPRGSGTSAHASGSGARSSQQRSRT